MRIIDLSMPIEPHFRWNPELQIKGDIAAGDQFRISRVTTTCHGFTHVDAKAHFVANAPTIEATPLRQVVGPCRVLKLRDAPANTAIGADRLAAADPGGPEGEIMLLSVGWDRKQDYRTPAFWTEAPWLTRDAADPQDYPIRLLLEGKSAPNEEQVTHDVLLKNGITLIEYLINTSALEGPRTLLCAAPLQIPNADGAPTRAFALESLNA